MSPAMRLDGEVLVDACRSRVPSGSSDDVVVGVVGDGAARRERRQPRAAPPAQPPLTRSRWRSAPARPRLVAMPSDEHVDDVVEVAARASSRVRRRAAGTSAKSASSSHSSPAQAATICCARMSSGASRSATASISARRAARTSAAHSTSSSRVSGKRRPLGVRAERVARAADALQHVAIERGEPSRHDEVDGADVDAQLERRGRDHDARARPSLSRRSAAMRGARATGCRGARRPRPAPSRSPRCSATRSTRRRVLTNTSVDRCSRASVGDAVVELGPLLVGAHRAELVLGHLDRQVEVAALADVDDRRAAAAPSDQQARRHLERPHRRRQADALRAARRRRHQRVEPLERQRQVRAALVGRDGVDLVDDHRAHVAQRPPPRLRRQQDEQRLRRGDQDVRRPPRRLAPLARGRVAGAHRRPDRRRRIAELASPARAARASGSSRFRRTSFDSAFSGET